MSSVFAPPTAPRPHPGPVQPVVLRNPSGPASDPEYRRERARRANAASLAVRREKRRQAELEAAVERVVAEAPALTHDQLHALAAVLRPAVSRAVTG